MEELVDPRWDQWRGFARKLHVKGATWEEVELAGKLDVDRCLRRLHNKEEDDEFPVLGSTDAERLERWRTIVRALAKVEQAAIREGEIPIEVGPDELERSITVPEDPASSWQLYRERLLKSGFGEEAVNSIEDSSLRIVRRLRADTRQKDPVKGMVVGYVQSGKTASMAGVLAMAADWGWNFFVVLTGTLENLRLQTADRLLGDLNQPGNLVWELIDQPSRKSKSPKRLQDLHLRPNDRRRYLTVALKNQTRLKGLKSWLGVNQDSEAPPNLEKLRILVIDDEADQGGINSASLKERKKDRKLRSKINQLIVDIVNTRRAGASNYVAYTATPYANFLNEAYPESLYPRDFIVALAKSPDHFGPPEVFGLAGAGGHPGGMGFVNDVPDPDVAHVAEELHKGADTTLPSSLKDAVMWFLCAVAALRSRGGFLKPVSMLVHTSFKRDHHALVERAILAFLDEDVAVLEKRARRVWRQQVQKLTLEQFKAFKPRYTDLGDVPDYPARFEAIRPELRKLLSAAVSAIPMLPTADGEALTEGYHRGIHVCVDNSSNNALREVRGDKEREWEHVRLNYPDKEECKHLGTAPAFIVIGGNTLSRGLTIQNLVSTYFLRASSLMDSLMQMGRWFGYRKGYELLPRIWMSEETRRKFEYMTQVEKELREDLKRFEDLGVSPAEFGPRVKVHPRVSWLRPTASGKQAQAVPCEFDYSGVNRQTTIFHAGPGSGTTLRSNIAACDRFFGALDATAASRSADRSAVVWRGVGFESVRELLQGMEFHGRSAFFGEINTFLKWCEQQELCASWNVVAAGRGVAEPGASDARDRWAAGGWTVGKVDRTSVKNASKAESISIGALREPRHLLADLPAGDEAPQLHANATNPAIALLRENGGLKSVPQLVVYRVDKDSKAKPRTRRGEDGVAKDPTRLDLNAAADLVGVSLWIPDAFEEGGSVGDGSARRRSFRTKVTVRIPDSLREASPLVEEES